MGPVGHQLREAFGNIAFISNETGARDTTVAAACGGALTVTLYINDLIGVSAGRSLIGGTAAGFVVAHAATVGMVYLFNKCVSRVRGY